MIMLTLPGADVLHCDLAFPDVVARQSTEVAGAVAWRSSTS